MNGRQAAKLAAKRIEELENFNNHAVADIKAYSGCIISVISGEKTFCDWCEEQTECHLKAKGKGCSEWWLKFNPEEKNDS